MKVLEGAAGRVVMLAVGAAVVASALCGGCRELRLPYDGYPSATYVSADHWQEEYASAIETYRELQRAEGWEIMSVCAPCAYRYSSDLQELPIDESIRTDWTAWFVSLSHDGRYLAYCPPKTESGYILRIVDQQQGTSQAIEAGNGPIDVALDLNLSLWSHTDSRLLYVVRTGDSVPQELHVYDAAEGDDKLVANQPLIKLVRWAPSDGAVAFLGKDGVLSVLRLESQTVTRVCDSASSYDWLDDSTLVVARWKGELDINEVFPTRTLFLYGLDNGTSQELFAGDLPLCLEGKRILYRLGRALFVSSLDGEDTLRIPGGWHDWVDVLGVSPCRRYILVRRQIRIKGWGGAPGETLILDANLEVCGATRAVAPGPCSWIATKGRNGQDR